MGAWRNGVINIHKESSGQTNNHVKVNQQHFGAHYNLSMKYNTQKQ